MNNEHGHIFSRFDKELSHIHGIVIKMGDIALRQLKDSVSSLKQQDTMLAREIIERDEELNKLDVQADDEIVQIIAKRQPMASDLREIIALGKIVAELERAGDEARKIAKLTIHLYDDQERSPDSALLNEIYDLATYTSLMLTDSMDAFNNLNLDKAVSVLNMDAELDKQLENSLRSLSTYVMEDPRNVGYFVNVVLAIRALDRFGNHATNIAEHIMFITNAIDVRHESVDSILQKVADDLSNKS